MVVGQQRRSCYSLPSTHTSLVKASHTKPILTITNIAHHVPNDEWRSRSRSQFYDSTVCFVNTHLSAHFEAVQRRNQDYREVCRRIIFGDEAAGEEVSTIFDHEYVRHSFIR